MAAVRVVRRMGVAAVLLGAAALSACAQQGSRDASVAPRLAPGGGGTTGATGTQAAATNLSGTWRYDVRQSGMGNRGIPMDASRGGFSGGGGFGGRTGGRPGGAFPGDERRDSLPRDSLARDSVMREMGRLVIEQTDTALTITVGRAAPLTVYTDWRETSIPGRYGPSDVTFVTGSWKNGRFEVRKVLPSRTVIVESYEISRDGRQLTVATRIAERSEERGELLPREGRRVYTKALE